MKHAILFTVVLSLTASPVFAQTQPQHDHALAGGDQVGGDSVSFVTSCAPALRQDFNRAVALLHSFWFAQAIAAFEGVAAKDPSCASARISMPQPSCLRAATRARSVHARLRMNKQWSGWFATFPETWKRASFTHLPRIKQRSRATRN